MARTNSEELYKAAAETTAKYIYFLLTITGASIAYSTQLAASVVIAKPILILAAAIFAWGYSFFAGCKSLESSISAQNIFYQMQQLTEAFRIDNPSAEQIELLNRWGAISNNHEEKHGVYTARQFRYFIYGSVLFVIWRITEIVLKNFPLLWN